MAEAAKRATARTTLAIEQVEVPISIFSTKEKPGKLIEFTTAGPNGGVLETETGAAAKPLSSTEPIPETPVVADPLGEEPIPLPDESSAPGMQAGGLVPGDFKRYMIESGSGQRVEPDEVRKGVRLENGDFVDCTDQLARIEADTKLEQMRVVEFIDVGQVERARIIDSYYVGADTPESAKPLKLIYEAMRINRRVAVVRWSNKSRQSLGVLTAHGNTGTLVLLKLAWAEDWRDAPAKAVTVGRTQVTVDEVRMASELVVAMAGRGTETLDGLRDEAIVLREELHAAALRGDVAPVEKVEQPSAPEFGIGAFEASLAELTGAGKG